MAESEVYRFSILVVLGDLCVFAREGSRVLTGQEIWPAAGDPEKIGNPPIPELLLLINIDTENPRLGTKVEVPDDGAEELRQLVIAPYVMRYVVEIDRIVVLRVWRSRGTGVMESN